MEIDFATYYGLNNCTVRFFLSKAIILFKKMKGIAILLSVCMNIMTVQSFMPVDYTQTVLVERKELIFQLIFFLGDWIY